MVYIIAFVPCSNVVYGVWSSIPQMESLYWVLYMTSIMLGKCITAKTGVNHYGLVYHYLGQQIIMLSFPLYTCTLKWESTPLDPQGSAPVPVPQILTWLGDFGTITWLFFALQMLDCQRRIFDSNPRPVGQIHVLNVERNIYRLLFEVPFPTLKPKRPIVRPALLVVRVTHKKIQKRFNLYVYTTISGWDMILLQPFWGLLSIYIYTYIYNIIYIYIYHQAIRYIAMENETVSSMI